MSVTADRPTAPQWERQPGESTRAFAAFTRYRDLPAAGRSIDAAWAGRQTSNDRAPGTGRAPGAWTRWSTQWRWVERAQTWDAHADRQVQQEVIHSRAQAVARALDAIALAEAAAQTSLQLGLPMPPGEAARVLLTASRARMELTQPVTAYDPEGDPLQQIIGTLTARLMDGDLTVAVPLSRFMDRQAARDGTDSPPRLSIEARLEDLYGGVNPIDIPVQLRQQLSEVLRARLAARDATEAGHG